MAKSEKVNPFLGNILVAMLKFKHGHFYQDRLGTTIRQTWGKLILDADLDPG